MKKLLVGVVALLWAMAFITPAAMAQDDDYAPPTPTPGADDSADDSTDDGGTGPETPGGPGQDDAADDAADDGGEAPGGETPGELANTGADSNLLIIVAIALVAAGGMVLVTVRRHQLS